MAYIQGTAESMFDLLEIIKNLATSQGWEVLGDISTPYNDIPRNGRLASVSGSTGALSNGLSNAKFNVIMQRPVKPINISFTGNAKVTIYSVLYDQTKELIAENVGSGYEFPQEIKEKEYIQFEITPNGNIYDFHLNFTSENHTIQERFISLSNNDDKNNVILNLAVQILTNGRANLIIGTSTGFSPELSINYQANTKLGYILSDDESVEYRINLNRHRIIVSTKIQRESEIWQICYYGRILIYGGEWALPDCNALMTTSLENTHFTQSLNANFNNPFLYFSGAFSQVSSTALSEDNANATICNIDAPISGEIVRFPIVCYRITDSYYTNQTKGDIFGEMDGFYSVILPPNVNRGDEISLNGESFIVIAKGSDFSSPYESYIMKKD